MVSKRRWNLIYLARHRFNWLLVSYLLHALGGTLLGAWLSGHLSETVPLEIDVASVMGYPVW